MTWRASMKRAISEPVMGAIGFTHRFLTTSAIFIGCRRLQHHFTRISLKCRLFDGARAISSALADVEKVGCHILVMPEFLADAIKG